MNETHPQEQQLAREWIGHGVIDESGRKIGEIDEIYVDEGSGRPEWVAIKTGWFGTKLSFAPLAGATAVGEDMCLPFSKDKVKGAPRIDPDGNLDSTEESELYAYYELGPETMQAEAAQDVRTGAAEEEVMVRSEEEIELERTRRPMGRARLRKFVVTEDVTMTVPVRHEEVRVVREPLQGDEARVARGDLGAQEQEVVLEEEVVRAHKEVVPKERVRLETELVTEEQEISEELRKEKVELERDDDLTRKERR